MIKPEISVIMAVYNTEKYLDESIKSVLNQTFSNFELIIINDNSKDNSLKIIQKYQQIDKRIILLNNSENIGPAASRNEGIKISKSKYIAILDSDDISLPKRLESQYEFLESHPDVFLCGTRALFIDEDGYTINRSEFIIGNEKIKQIMPRRNCIIHSSIMFRNEGIYYREKFTYAQDYDFYLILLSKGLVLENLKDILVKYRVVSGNISSKGRNKQDLFAEKAQSFYKQRAKVGKDEYEQFNPLKILSMKDINSQKSALKYKMGICLQNRDFNNAKLLLCEYKNINNKFFIESIPYSMIITYPFIYNFYIKIKCYLKVKNF